MSAVDDRVAVFDALYTDSPDPWGTRTRWYERRKRALLMAALPAERYGAVYEVGCGTGHISRDLAARCGSLLASDASDAALAVARPQLADLDNVTVAKHRLPDEWPDRPFDLVVVSEVLYFLDDAQCDAVAAAARRSVGPAGTVVACDWRGPIEGRGQTGDAVHRRFEAALSLPRLFEYVDDDFVLSAWSVDTRTAAVREGLR